MRAGPLSDKRVIDTLNRYFVPVTSANEVPDPERRRIYGDFYTKKLGIGDVHLYVVGPDGVSIGGMDIGSAMDPVKQLVFLNSVVARLQTQPGPPVFAPHPRVTPPQQVEPGAPAIHLVARKLIGKVSWNDFPSENWILLTRQEWDQILPAPGSTQGAEWTIPGPVAVKLAEWIYPQTEEKTTANRSRVELADFRLTLVTLQGSLGRARIDGNARQRHSLAPSKPADDYAATAELLGYVDFDLASRQVKRFRMVTTKADYYNLPFACSLVSMSRETLDAQQ